MKQPEVVTLNSVAASFPEIEEPLVYRDNLLDTIERMFLGEISAVIVEGEDGVGKTNLLAQFARRHSDRSISIFLSSASRWALDSVIVRLDLCNQMNWILHKEELPDSFEATESNFRNILFSLQKLAQRESKIFYFILDGLDQVPPNHWSSVKPILDLIPIGLPRFRTLISGAFDLVMEGIPSNIKCRSFTVPYFTLEEMAAYFSDLAIQASDLRPLAKLSRGVPANLASIKRILRGGGNFSLQTLLDDRPDQLQELFQIEWSRVDFREEGLSLFLSVIAQDGMPLSVAKLSDLLKVDAQRIERWISTLSFVEVGRKNGSIGYVSHSFREFAARRLGQSVSSAQGLLIDYLLSRSEDDDALNYLPTHLDKTNRSEELLGFLTSEKILRMFEKEESLSSLRQKMLWGLRAASRTRRDGDLLRFSVASSIFMEFEEAQVWRSEVDARLELSDYESALALAQNTFTKEDRLHLLAVIGKHQREQGGTVDAIVLDQIRQLFGKIDAASLGRHSIEIAADLLPVLPELAVELVEKSVPVSQGENSLDWAFASVSAMALDEARGQKGDRRNIIDAIRPRLKAPEVQSFHSALSIMTGGYSVEELLAEVGTLKKTGEKIYIVKNWCKANPKAKDAIRVINYAIDILIATTGYAPTAQLFCDLAAPLPYISDLAALRRLVGLIDAQRGMFREVGPTEDNIGLQLKLAQGESRYSMAAATTRLIEAYYSIQELSDLCLKAACLARIVVALEEIDKEGEIERGEGLGHLSLCDLRECVGRLLSASADHYIIMERMLEILSSKRMDLAVEFAMLANSEYRRDQGLAYVVTESIDRGPAQVDYKKILDARSNIKSEALRDEAVVDSLRGLLVKIKKAREVFSPDEFLPWLPYADEIGDLEMRCQAYCFVVRIAEEWRAEGVEAIITHCLARLRESWDAIDAGWEKIDIGFKIVRTLAPARRGEAVEYMRRAEGLRTSLSLGSHNAAMAYANCVRLAIRALSGLLPQKFLRDEDSEMLIALIDRVPSASWRISLWSDWAVILHVSGQAVEAARIVSERIRPLLRLLDKGQTQSLYWSSIFESCVALYCGHKTTALNDVAKIPSPNTRDAAYIRIADFIIRQVLPDDPYEQHPAQPSDLSFTDCIDLCEIVALIDEDSAIYHLISIMVDSVSSRRGQAQFSQQQLAEIRRRIEEVSKRLPNPRFITHVGYLIAVEAKLLRLSRSSLGQWEALTKKAENIRNIADKILVQSFVAEGMLMVNPDRGVKELIRLEQEISLLPATVDRVSRYEHLTIAASKFDNPLAKAFLKKTWNAALEDGNPDSRDRLARVVDFAYSLDPTLASSLSTLSEDDPTRSIERELIKRRLRECEGRKKLMEGASSEDSSSSIGEMEDELPRASKKLLGLLNANRVLPLSIERIRSVIERGSRSPFLGGDTTFSWILQGMVKKYGQTRDAASYFRPFFDSLVSCAELIERVSVLVDKRLRVSAKPISLAPISRSMVVRVGEREKAMVYLRTWIAENVRSVLKICDPYFGPWDLAALRLILEAEVSCRVEILTSRRHQEKMKVSQPWENAYRSFWRRGLSALEPPDTEIIVVGIGEGGDSPIHDRWWITKGAGLRMGTSFGSIGNGKETEIAPLSDMEAQAREREVDGFLSRTVRYQEAQRLTYTIFTL